MKRGKKTRQWDNTRRKLKEQFERAGIVRCEVCNGTFALSFAHRLKRRFITDQQELETVALLCQICHNEVEYAGHDEMSLREIYNIKKTVVDSLDYVMPFGKHKGKTIGWIIEVEPWYIQWLHENTDMDFDFKVLEQVEGEDQF